VLQALSATVRYWFWHSLRGLVGVSPIRQTWRLWSYVPPCCASGERATPRVDLNVVTYQEYAVNGETVDLCTVENSPRRSTARSSPSPHAAWRC